MKVYRKVEIDDRYVGLYHLYFKSNGDMVFGVVWLEQSTCLWKCTEQDGDEHYVTHCIEEIELPSEDEIDSKIPYKSESPFHNATSQGFKLGVNFILNKLKG